MLSAPSLSGLSLVEQHRRVYEALAAPLADGTIHELRIKTKGGWRQLQQIQMHAAVRHVRNSQRAAGRAWSGATVTVDVLPDPQTATATSQAERHPQVFKGELVGGTSCRGACGQLA